MLLYYRLNILIEHQSTGRYYKKSNLYMIKSSLLYLVVHRRNYREYIGILKYARIHLPQRAIISTTYYNLNVIYEILFCRLLVSYYRGRSVPMQNNMQALYTAQRISLTKSVKIIFVKLILCAGNAFDKSIRVFIIFNYPSAKV